MSDVLNAMTIDVEEHFQVSGFEGFVSRDSWESQPSRVVDNTARLLDLLDECEVLGTFFVLGWVAGRNPDLVRRIAARGHEIASHGFSHRLIYDQQRDEFHGELERSKKLLEDLSGAAVRGHRAASFSIDQRNLWALDVIAELGFDYDSSLFPVHHDRYGLPDAPRDIYRVETPEGRSLVEVPPSTVRVGRWTLPVAGGGYLRLFPIAVTRWAIRRLNLGEHRSAVVYVHPWEVDPEQPRVHSAPWSNRARHYVNLGSTADKLRRLMQSSEFATMSQVIDRAGALRSVALHT